VPDKIKLSMVRGNRKKKMKKKHKRVANEVDNLKRLGMKSR